MREEELMKVTKSIVFSQLALMSNEDIKHTSIYNKKLKNYLNLALKELIKAEKQNFDLIEGKDEETVRLMSNNILDFIDDIYKNNFVDSIILGNIVQAYFKNQKAITGITNKILNK